MEIRTSAVNGCTIAVISSQTPVIVDSVSALDLIMTVKYQHSSALIAIDKRAIAEEFFILSSGLAGEVLQKFINYQAKLAIFGDFSGYTSKPLRDFIRESNRGRDIFFTATEEEALARLAAANL